MGKQEVWKVLGSFARLKPPRVDFPCRWGKLPLWWALVSAGLLCATSVCGEPAPENGSDKRAGYVLPVDAEGHWQVIELPINWMRKFLKETKAREISVALLGPDPEEIGADNAPCGPRQSVQLIATGRNGQSRAEVLLNGAFCSREWRPAAGLEWAAGPNIKIVAISVVVAPEGDLTLTYHIEKSSGGHSDTAGSDKPQIGSWTQSISLKEIQELAKRL